HGRQALSFRYKDLAGNRVPATANLHEHTGNNSCYGRIVTVSQKVLVFFKAHISPAGHALEKAYIRRGGRIREFQMQARIGCQLDRVGDVSVTLFLEIQTFKHIDQQLINEGKSPKKTDKRKGQNHMSLQS
ncbi:hypothetical protein ACIXFX_24925, partial [Bacteroides fragilis]